LLIPIWLLVVIIAGFGVVPWVSLPKRFSYVGACQV